MAKIVPRDRLLGLVTEMRGDEELASDRLRSGGEALIHHRREIERAMEGALSRGTFYLDYQPIFNCTGDIVQVEALLRARDPLLRRLGPAKYVPVAEESGLIIPIGEQVLQKACLDMSDWAACEASAIKLAINVSCVQLAQPGFADRALETFDAYRIRPDRVNLELTETALMEDVFRVLAQMHMLTAAGVCFSIDDFGTGYSSLQRLSELPVSTLKIDRAFVKEIRSSETVLQIVHSIVHLAEHLGLDLIAEGVEYQEELEILSALGCDKFQGFLLSRPVSAEMLLVMLALNK